MCWLAAIPCFLPGAIACHTLSSSTSASTSARTARAAIVRGRPPALGELATAGGDEEGFSLRGVIERRPRAGDDHRQAQAMASTNRQGEASPRNGCTRQSQAA